VKEVAGGNVKEGGNRDRQGLRPSFAGGFGIPLHGVEGVETQRKKKWKRRRRTGDRGGEVTRGEAWEGVYSWKARRNTEEGQGKSIETFRIRKL